MKYVFFGTPRFADIVLAGLIEAGMPPTTLICNPDRPVGRKKIITAPPTKQRVVNFSNSDRNITVFQPEKIDENFINLLRELNPDFFVVAAYAKILPQAILAIPRLGTLGVHPSLLPKHRGAAPIQSAILAGDERTGTTIYLMDEKTDHGPVFAKEALPAIPTSGLPYFELEKSLAELGAKLLITIIPDFLAGKITPQPQDETRATFTKKFKTEDGFIDADDLAAAQRDGGSKDSAEKAIEILRKINAFNPEPGAWTMENGKRIKLLAAKINGGRLVLTETQKEGERPRQT